MNRLGLIILLALVTSCARFEPRPIVPAQTAARFEERSLDNAVLKSFVEKSLDRELSEWPPKRWNLELLTLAAYFYHPSLDVARAQCRVAEAAAVSAGARPNPTVSVAPGFTANAASGVSPWLLTVGFDWPVETAGKRALRIARAKQQMRAAQFNLLTTAWQVRAGVRDNLAAYRFAGNQSGVFVERVSFQKQIVAKLEERLKAGAISPSDITLARVALGKMEAELGAARENENSAAARLAEAVGISLRVLTNAPKEMTLYTPQLSDEQTAEKRQHALLNRSDVLAALADYDASETALRLEIAKQYPDLRFSPSYEYDQGDNKWRLGVSLELPLLNRNEGPIAEAKAKRDEAAARFMALQAKVISEIDAAVQNFQQARRRHFDLIPTMNAGLQNERAMEAQVRAGAADALDLLGVKLERLGSTELFSESGYRSEQAFGRLEDAVQQIFERRPGVIAPPPPEQLALSPREESVKP